MKCDDGCGTVIPDGEQFCPRCGTAAPRATETPRTVPRTPLSTPPRATAPLAPTPVSSRRPLADTPDVVIQNATLISWVQTYLLVVAVVGGGVSILLVVAAVNALFSSPSEAFFVVVAAVLSAALTYELLKYLNAWRVTQVEGVVLSARRDLIEFPSAYIRDNTDSEFLGLTGFKRNTQRDSASISGIIAIDGHSATSVVETSEEVRVSHSYSVILTYPERVIAIGFGGDPAKKEQFYNLLARLIRAS